MKKNLLILAFVAPFAFGQTTFFVGNGASVKVKKSTLVHTNGSFKVAEGTTGRVSNDGKVSNDGHVNVQGSFTGNSDGTRFVNEFTSVTEYGQLIIKNGTAVSGKITSKYKYNTDFAYQRVAFPFTDYIARNAVKDSRISDPHWDVYSGNRYVAPIFKSNNEEYVLDNLSPLDPIVATGAYSVNQFTTNLRNKLDKALVEKSLVGKANNVSETLSGTSTASSLSVKKNHELNKYKEFYGSYIVDPTRQMPLGWNDYIGTPGVVAGEYGSNLYSFGNPYTSNLDISALNASEGIEAVVVYTSNNRGGINSNANKLVGAEVSYYVSSLNPGVIDNVVVGDDIQTIRPHQVFLVRGGNSGFSYTLTDNNKTFGITGRAVNVAPSVASKGISNNKSDFYQVGLDLYSNDKNTGSRLYVVASDFYKAKGETEYEAYNTWNSDDDVALYSVQENEDGTVAEELSNQKVYINGINATDYVAKPVSLVFQGKDNTPYTFKARLNDALLNSKNIFYFEDKKEGKVMEITPDFEYTFVEPTVNKDRFVIYWNGLPSTLGTQEVVSSSETQIYKDGQDHKVRFATGFKKADVYVYDLNGRLISVEKLVDASVDHTLPYLSNGKVFIVKVVGDNGVITTQKIIK